MGKSVGEPSNPVAAGSGGWMVLRPRVARWNVGQSSIWKPLIPTAYRRGEGMDKKRKRFVDPLSDEYLESVTPETLRPFEFFESFARKNRIKDCRNPNPPERDEEQLSVLGLELKILDEKQLRPNLRCVITVQDDDASEDIYNGKLPIPITAAAGDRFYLQLIGPGNFITLDDSNNGIFFVVALTDDDDDETVAALKPHVCKAECLIEYKSCGTFAVGRSSSYSPGFRCFAPGLFLWEWSGLAFPDEVLCTVDLLKNIRGLPTALFPASDAPPSYGCSLNLKFAAFRDAVVAKVKVMLVKTESHNNICSCGCGLVITAECGNIYRRILLFRKDECSCSQSINEDNNIIIENPSPEDKIELELSRSFVTMPAPTHPPTVLRVVLGSLCDEAVRDSVSFCTRRFGTTRNKISSRGGVFQVTVKWM